MKMRLKNMKKKINYTKENSVTIGILITKEQKHKLEKMAVAEMSSINRLIRVWIEREYKKYEEK
jgi:hypothetical protein